MQMRQVNFVMIFVICLALVLFGIENTEPVGIKLVKGVGIQAPLCVELIVAMGIGALLAWVFSVWVQVQRVIATRQELSDRDAQIENLQEDLERYKAEIEAQQRLLPSASIE
jgi:uncharacterized integral membrane protein